MKKKITLIILILAILALIIGEVIYELKSLDEIEHEMMTSLEQDPDELEVDLSIEENNEDASIDK